MIGRVHRAVSRKALQLGERARKRVRIDRFALDQPAIAERSAPTGAMAIHQHDIPIACGKVCPLSWRDATAIREIRCPSIRTG
jgi:hypothetical protein